MIHQVLREARRGAELDSAVEKALEEVPEKDIAVVLAVEQV